MKKTPELLQPNRSGVPCKLLFSSLIHEICGTDFLSFSYNFRSGFKVTRAFYSGVLGAIINFSLVGFNTTEEVKQFGDFTPDSVTIDQLGANNKKAIKLMRKAGWD